MIGVGDPQRRGDFGHCVSLLSCAGPYRAFIPCAVSIGRSCRSRNASLPNRPRPARWQSTFHVLEQMVAKQKSAVAGGGMAVASSSEAQSLVVNETQIDFIDRGSGPPLLFLHAENGIDPAAPVIDELAKSARVIAPTHPGYGRSEVPKGMRSIDD